ncbi:MAG: HDOD domain-containing protein [Steroidobacteraceae bacterium]
MFADLHVGPFFLAIAVVAASVGSIYWRRRSSRAADAARRSAANTTAPGWAEVKEDDAPVEYSSEATAAAIEQYQRLAFSAGRIDYHISGQHAVVLDAVTASVASSIHERDYFPRRPMQLPRLLQAINDTESTRQRLVKLILEDPSLAGAVLKRANSAFYRVSPVPVERLDRAVAMLGAAGLRSLLATALLQPVFRVPKGYFDMFAEVTWEQARRSAQAAEACSRGDRDSDPFVAQLLGLVSSLAGIVLFRLAMEKYREQPNLLPRAEVFITAMQLHQAELACMIARSWEMSDMSLQAAQEQVSKLPPQEMSLLGRAMYYGNLCGALAVLHSRSSYVGEVAIRLLIDQGLDAQTATASWQAATADPDKN